MLACLLPDLPDWMLPSSSQPVLGIQPRHFPHLTRADGSIHSLAMNPGAGHQLLRTSLPRTISIPLIMRNKAMQARDRALTAPLRLCDTPTCQTYEAHARCTHISQHSSPSDPRPSRVGDLHTGSRSLHMQRLLNPIRLVAARA